MIKDIKNALKYIGVFTILFLGLSYYYNLDFWMVQRPRSVHVWRQTDCASYALNYYQNNRPFFRPQVHHRHAIEGSTASEFPIIYYVASKFYRWFGFRDYYIRWINYTIFYLGLIALILASRYYIKNNILAVIPSLLMMMSCVLVYYGSNFLPDVPALSLAIIGFYFFTKYLRTTSNFDFVWAVMFSTLATLIKVSSGIIMGLIVAYMIYERWITKRKTFNNMAFAYTAAGILAVFSWLYYVRIYNEEGQYFGNLQGTMGIWLCKKEEIEYIFKRSYEEWQPALASRKLWLLLPIVIIYTFWRWKKLDATLRFFMVTGLVAIIVYLVSFFAVFNVHDYYFVNVFIWPILLVIGFLSVLEKEISNRYMKLFYGASILLMAMTAEDTQAQFKNRQYHGGWNAHPPKGFFDIEPYLRSIGIDRHQLIFSPSDPSTNITLYYANNPGWARLFGNLTAEEAKARGAKYMLLTKEDLEKPEFIGNKSKVIGEWKGIAVVNL
jgi:hypothetical protein